VSTGFGMNELPAKRLSAKSWQLNPCSWRLTSRAAITNMTHIGARLAAPEQYEPLVVLEMREDADAVARMISECFSEAVAYIRTFEKFDGDKESVAHYLAIRIRTLDCRVERASNVQRFQPSIFDGIERIPVDFMPARGHRKSYVQDSGGTCSVQLSLLSVFPS